MTSIRNILVTVVIVCGILQNGCGNYRQRKDLINFLIITAMKSGRNPLDYLNYGRYCGYGGSGYAVDATDNCCKAHDECYTKIKNMKDCDNLPKGFYYFLSYSWENTEDGDVRCESKNDTQDNMCKADLCQCDVDMVHCVITKPYNSANHTTMLWRIFESFLTNTVEFISNILFPFF